MLHFKLILNVLGILLIAIGVLMIVPLLFDFVYQNSSWLAFLISSMISVSFGIALFLSTRGGNKQRLIMQDAFLLTSSSWILIALFGSIPFFLSDSNMNFTDSFFESMSGVTTTGSSVIQNISDMSEGILIWRALLQWLGGVGIIVMALSILPVLQVGGMQVFRTESSDTTEKILPRTAQISAAVIIIYLILTFSCFSLYWIFGMNAFDSFAHSMTTIATGGFSTKNTSIAFFDNAYIEYTSAVFMILSSLPILIYLKFSKQQFKSILKDTQVRTFLIIVFSSVFFVVTYLWLNDIKNLNDSIRYGFVNVTSIITGTGYTTDNYNLWGPFPIYLLFFGMFIGGCAGSTTCGIKVFRFQILFETFKNQIQKLLHPHGVFVPHYNHKKLESDVTTSVMSFFFVFILVFVAITLLLSMTNLDFVTSLSAAATSLANVGPGLGSTIGPDSTFYSLSISAKWILIISMLLGRLELFTILVLFLPAFWRK
jgi:trk system potassium uptake protein TrkH